METLLKLAMRFQMVEVSKWCERYLMNTRTEYTLARRLYLAQEFGLSKLKACWKGFILHLGSECFRESV